jgi:hypothetical protein
LVILAIPERPARAGCPGRESRAARAPAVALKQFPPMQPPESYNLTQVMDQIKAAGHASD